MPELEARDIEIELLRLNLDTALAHIDGAISTMADGLRPILTVPLARQEIVQARATVDAMLDRDKAR